MMTTELGVDRIFGRGTTPREVASYLVDALVTNKQKAALTMTDPREGLVVTHRRYVPYSHAHYAGNLVDGAYALGLFGDVATEVCIRTDGDEGLFASYSDVQFRGADAGRRRPGDHRDRDPGRARAAGRIEFVCAVVCRGPAGPVGESAAEVLDPPIVAVTATGTVVVPPPSA